MVLNEEQTQEYKEIFSLFDKRGNGTIEPEALGDVLRAVGQNPTQAQIRDLIAGIPESAKPLKFETVLDIISRPDGFKPAGSHEEFVQGFQVFDKDGNGFINAGELRYVLTALGEKLTDNEVDDILKGVEVGKDGSIAYEEFVKMITAA
ncbi:essential light chain for Myo1p, light chain for Myo2p [Paraphysoderma sedebokerense]|nr:essential light chain for Myo1p, light chain for Myo2p [Paraphysoderma sedebokerense]